VMSGWSVGAFDFDNDGYKDLFVTNSHASENVEKYSFRHYRQHNAVFRNRRDGTFLNVSAAAGLASEPARAHRGGAFGDLNNDGGVDVVTSSIGSMAEIWFNTTPSRGHWILIETIGRKSNRDGIGTTLKVTAASGRVQYNHVTTSVGYLSSSDRRVHFGLGDDAVIEKLELRWPSGRIQTLKNLAVDRVLKVTEE